MRALLVTILIAAAGCEGPMGPAGPPGSNGSNGSNGSDGSNGQNGDAGPPGPPGTSPWLTAPGVQLSITSLAFAGGKATVSFTLTDPKGVALDRDGKLTEGAVSTGFALAQLAQNPDGTAAQYTAYTTRVQTAPSGASAVQGATDSGGTYAVVDVTKGEYTYTFAADVSAYDSSLTQTVAGNATRTMNDGTTALAANDYSIGAQTPVLRQVITQAACDGCHGGLTAHGGHWRAVTQCVLCHQPQSSDPDTGNTVDFKVMIHKIHDGSSLPSVVAGGKYHIVGYQQSDNDFSTIEFPQAVNRCEACHAANATQASNWMNQPSIATCTSCHDTTSFDATPPAGMTEHSGGPRTDAQCLVCHADNSIYPVRTVHNRGVLDPTAPKLAISIDTITNTAPGLAPTIAFTVTTTTGGVTTPTNILTAPVPRLRVTFAGPNTDYATFWQATIQGSGASGTLAAATDGSDGKFLYTVPAAAAIPAAATGSYTVGMEGYLLDAAGTRLAMENPMLAFAVTDPAPVPRRQVVSYDACNACHGTLNHHGPDGQGARRDPQYCVMCHNPNNTGNGTTRYQGQTVLAESVDFKGLIHGIHMGELRTAPLQWVSGASQTTPGGTLTTWPTQYPRDQGSCKACHQGTTFTLPLDTSLLPAIDQELTCGVSTAPGTGCPTASWPVVTQTISTPAESEACLGCHDAPYTAVHAALNTTADGRTACATCHGPGMIEDVAKVHQVN